MKDKKTKQEELADIEAKLERIKEMRRKAAEREYSAWYFLLLDQREKCYKAKADALRKEMEQ